MKRILKWLWNLAIALNMYAAFNDNLTFRRLISALANKLRLLVIYLAEKLK